MAIKLKKLWTQIRSRALVWDTITTTGWSTVGKGMGFLVPFFVAAWFGVTAETDAFFFAYGLILFFSMTFAPVVESIIVPYIAEARSNNEDVGKFVGRILGISGIGLLALVGIVLLVIKPVLSVITRFDQQSLDLVYWILVETAPLIILLVWTSILAGTLNAYKKFVFPAVSPLFRAVFNIGFIFIFKDALGVHAIALGYVVGEIVRLAILAGVIQRLKLFKLGLSFNLDLKLKEFLKTASYQVIGMVAVGFNPVVDRVMASWLKEGSVSVLYYADRLYMIPVTFIMTGLLITLLSHWSKGYYELGSKRLNDDVQRIVRIVGFISILIMLFLIAIHQQVVQMVFGHGVFDRAILSEVGWVWLCYLFGFVPYVISQILNRRLLILKRTKLLFALSFLWVSINIILNAVLMHFLQAAGIALSTTVVYTLASIILFNLFIRETKAINAKEISN